MKKGAASATRFACPLNEFIQLEPYSFTPHHSFNVLYMASIMGSDRCSKAFIIHL